ncbi:type II CRISPR RNA-guided endonuclease Cas9 [Ruminococcus sp.]|uniref:type II CRISPR RNA-guided endonuclease Cas9 n=1 Tax=Ruminococcus sp. TaxID=41978 RepID=UPI002E787254|nr:type II CRISPR RNA-guided endonuclease Cas9 [Ruminococcus sp.]MEE0740649.1 type II CRISPR RNA-guided endonuclease Cas9 [Ruminococcus sp.]
MDRKEYFIGLDMGTDSVGWAVTDTEYKVIKFNQKALWGVRLFDGAKTAAERRGFRTSRRRVERRNQRLNWLQNVFSEEIAKKDPGFFQRLKESMFSPEDKRSDFEEQTGRFSLFNDSDYTDKEYYKDYPTISHLKVDLLEKDKKFDIRLIYLAVHHIIKKRGHFLFDDISADDEITFDIGFNSLNDYLEDCGFERVTLNNKDDFTKTLLDKKIKVKDKTKLLLEHAGYTKKDKQKEALFTLISGGSGNIADLYDDESLKELKSIKLANYENFEAELSEVLGDDFELINRIKAVYDWALLEDILQGETYISTARKKIYEKHAKDLKLLKQLVRKYLTTEDYREIFRVCSTKIDNYTAYSGNYSDKSQKSTDDKLKTNPSASREDFYKYIKKKFKPFEDKDDVKAIFSAMEENDFLPKQVGAENGLIPHQINERELKKILENSSKYYPFLNEITDESGLTTSEKILQVFNFKIPYYIGPLNKNSKFAWLERTDEKIYPWNFSDVVDTKKSAENFIVRMTAKCTYTGADVLPKDSLLYSKYMVLNEINKLKINGEPITVEQKQSMYNDLFMRYKTVKTKTFKDYLKNNFGVTDADVVSGIDMKTGIKASLSSYHAFRNILENYKDEEMVEDIIRHIVLFGDDKKLIKSYISEKYGHILSEADIKYAASKKFTGWGRLSKELLTKIYHVTRETGEAKSIITSMWEDNKNLMELLSCEYDYMDKAIEYKKQHMPHGANSVKDFIEESYASPSVKRAIIQATGIINEIEKIMKASPKRIFIEMAREKEDPKKKKKNEAKRKPRKDQLIELYKRCGEEESELFASLQDTSEEKLRKDSLYFYYAQLGRCMYSGERISIERLSSDYDIDHIYPRSKTKDDSLDNRVLVKKELNRDKTDEYPINPNIQKKMISHWNLLEKKGGITKEKYKRLTRTSEFTDSELAGFINRQLVETRQSSKVTAEILQSLYGDNSEIVYVKGGNVSDFRKGSVNKKTGEVERKAFVKCRDINDYHHAKDAYLNIVVGNVYHIKFTKSPVNFIKELKKSNQAYSLNKVFDYPVERGGETAWIPGKEGTFATVERQMSKNNILFTRLAYEVKGGFYDQQLLKKGFGQAPIKASDERFDLSRKKYGGYNNSYGAYFTYVEHDNKKKRIRSIEPVFILNKNVFEEDPVKYCTEVLNLKNPVVLIKQIKIDSLISIDGFRGHISGRTGVQIILKNANQLLLEDLWHDYVKKLSKYLDRCKDAQKELTVTKFDGITKEENLMLYDVITEKLNTKLYAVKYGTPYATLKENRDKFKDLSAHDQAVILNNILNMLKCNAVSADLKLLTGKAGIGILLISKNLYNYMEKEIKLIHQSITGVFEKTVDLLGDFGESTK